MAGEQRRWQVGSVNCGSSFASKRCVWAWMEVFGGGARFGDVEGRAVSVSSVHRFRHACRGGGSTFVLDFDPLRHHQNNHHIDRYYAIRRSVNQSVT